MKWVAIESSLNKSSNQVTRQWHFSCMQMAVGGCLCNGLVCYWMARFPLYTHTHTHTHTHSGIQMCEPPSDQYLLPVPPPFLSHFRPLGSLAAGAPTPHLVSLPAGHPRHQRNVCYVLDDESNQRTACTEPEDGGEPVDSLIRITEKCCCCCHF